MCNDKLDSDFRIAERVSIAELYEKMEMSFLASSLRMNRMVWTFNGSTKFKHAKRRRLT